MSDDFYYAHAACNKPVESSPYLSESYCPHCEVIVQPEDTTLIRVKTGDMGNCTRCGVALCEALDKYWGTDAYEKSMCEPCRINRRRRQDMP